VFKGTVSEPASVTIQGKSATVDSTNRFSGSVPAPSGTTTVVIAATERERESDLATYEVDQASASKAFTYDANGNFTSDGTRTFEWDARIQHIAINVGVLDRSYVRRTKAAGKRHREGEQHVQSDMRVLWCGRDICEWRAADG